MALVFHSGFETGDFSEWSSVTNSPTVSQVQVNTGDYAMRCDTTSTTAYVENSAVRERQGSFNIYIAATPSGECIIAGWNGVSSYDWNIRLQTDLTIDLYDGDVSKDTGATVLEEGQWYRISYANSSNAQQVWIDGNIELSAAEAQDLNLWLERVGVNSAVTADLYFDDIVFGDATDLSDLGDIRVQVALPRANGNLNDYDQQTGYLQVDNLPDDTDEVEDNGSALAREQFQLPSMTTMGIDGETPEAVNCIIRVDRDGGGSTVHGFGVRDNSTDYDTAHAGTAAYTQYDLYYDARPSSGAWTEAAWDAFQVGVNHTGPQDQHCSTCLAMLAYTVSGSTDVTPTPDAEALTIAVLAPTVLIPTDVTPTPDEEALTIAVLAPTIVIDKTFIPDALALTTAVIAPTILITAIVAVVALVLTLLAPTIVIDATFTPDTLALTSAAVDPVSEVADLPATLSLTSAVLDPTIIIDATPTPDAQGLTSAVLAPVPKVTTLPNTLALTISEVAPDIVIDALFIPAALELTIAVLDEIPSVTTLPSAQELTIVVLDPIVSTGTNVTVEPDEVALTSAVLAPIPSVITLPSTLSLSINEVAPTIIGDATPTPDAIGLTTAVLTPIPEVKVIPSILGLSLSVLSPDIVIDATPEPSTLALSINVEDPTVSAGSLIQPDSQDLTISVLAPTVVIDATTTPDAQALSVNVLSPIPSVTSLPDTLALSVSAESVIPNITVLPDALNLSISVETPTVVGDVLVQPSALTLTINVLTPTITGPVTRLFEVDRTNSKITLTADTRIGNGTTSDVKIDSVGRASFTGLSRINWTKIAANGVSLTNYTSADAVGDLQTDNDGNIYTCTEVAGGNNNLVVDFTDVTAFNWVRILAYYAGNNVHSVEVQVEVTPFDGSAWHTFDCICHQPATTNVIENHNLFLPSDSAYINGGVVKVRFLHSSSTTAGHVLVIDECSLYQ